MMDVTSSVGLIELETDAIWILSSTFIIFNMQSGKCERHVYPIVFQFQLVANV